MSKLPVFHITQIADDCNTDPTAYVSSQFEWVCETCYRSYVVPRSIAFADN